MTTKIEGSSGVQFPDATVQSTAAVVDGPAFRAINGSNQGVSAGLFTKAALDTVQFDTNNCFANGRFTPNVEGDYQINVSIHHNSTGLTAASTAIQQNGVGVASNGPAVTPAAVDQVSGVSTVLYFNGTTDFVELFGFQTGGANNLFANGLTTMSGFLARKA